MRYLMRKKYENRISFIMYELWCTELSQKEYKISGILSDRSADRRRDRRSKEII